MDESGQDAASWFIQTKILAFRQQSWRDQNFRL